MGIVFDIQRCSYHDGPGIRTTVFLKGCPLRCAWCHNPESFRLEPQLQYFSHLCTGCRSCGAHCPQGAHSFAGGFHQVHFAACTACGLCAKHCPQNALKLVGQDMSAREVLEIVKRDTAFYQASSGGITISGGEPSAQPSFLLELLTLAREEALHTCLETNGYIPKELLFKLLPLVDLFLLDYKITGKDARLQYTRASGALWENTLALLQRENIPVILRLPIIPGINDTVGHFKEAALLKNTHSCIQKAEIMPYHSIGAAKWEQLGLSYPLKDLPDATAAQTALWQSMLESYYPGEDT